MYKNKFLSLLLVFSLVICGTMGTGKGAKAEENVTTEESGKNPQVESGSVEEEEPCEKPEEDIDEVAKDIDLKVNITAMWDHHYNAEVELTNLTGERIDDWEISFDFCNKIEHIWNAKIIDCDEESNLYTIHNADWNQDIPSEGKVSFGMTVSYDEEIDSPSDWYLTRTCLEVEEDYDVKYTEYSRWGDNVNGQFIITNNSERRIEDWKVEILSNLTIKQVWNAEVVDEDRGYFDNMGYNQNIEPGQSVSFGFIAECDGDEVEVYDQTLYEMITIPEELEGNPNWEEEVTEDELAQYEFEPEEFETEQDYYDYLERQKRLGILDEEQKVKLQSRTQIQTKSEKVEAVDKPIKAMDTLTLNKSDIKFTIVNAGKYATQAFYLKTKEGYAYLSQRKDKEVVISKCIIDKNNKINLKECVSQMHLTGFDHGQSLEMFSYGGNEYLMVTAGKLPKHSMGNKVAFIQYRKGSYCYGQYKNEKAIQAKILCKAGYANKQKKREGIPKQVEVALSEDKSTLLVWSQVAHKKNEGRKIQLTCYDLKKVMKQLINVEKKVTKKNKKNKMNDMVRLSFQKIDSKACITTALQTDKNKNIVKPYNSIQSIDLANGSSGKYKVYICGGNDKKQRKLSIATMRLSKGKDITKNSKYLCRQNVKLDKSIFDDIKEMEGMHYRGSLRFVIAPATGRKIGKSTQYLFEIDASRVEK